MKLQTMDSKQIRSAERTLSAGTWAITFGAILFSVLTVTPLVERVTPDSWDWTAPVLPIVVDAAVVIVVRLDSTVARLGGDAGRWPAVLRWLTGLMTVALNVGDSALKGDLVGVGVHLVAPALLIVTAEAGLAYRRAISAALDRIERERQEQQARERADREARERRTREDRERERADRERQQREAREHAEQLERERLDREELRAREEREHAAQLQREEREAEERRELQRLQREDAERERERQELREREARERADREQREQRARIEREAREHREAAAHEQQSGAGERGKQSSRERAERPTKARSVNTAKAPEERALEMIRAGLDAGQSVRQLATDTGWSVGWVAARVQELRDGSALEEQPELSLAG